MYAMTLFLLMFFGSVFGVQAADTTACIRLFAYVNGTAATKNLTVAPTDRVRIMAVISNVPGGTTNLDQNRKMFYVYYKWDTAKGGPMYQKFLTANEASFTADGYVEYVYEGLASELFNFSGNTVINEDIEVNAFFDSATTPLSGQCYAGQAEYMRKQVFIKMAPSVSPAPTVPPVPPTPTVPPVSTKPVCQKLVIGSLTSVDSKSITPNPEDKVYLKMTMATSGGPTQGNHFYVYYDYGGAGQRAKYLEPTSSNNLGGVVEYYYQGVSAKDLVTFNGIPYYDKDVYINGYDASNIDGQCASADTDVNKNGRVKIRVSSPVPVGSPACISIASDKTVLRSGENVTIKLRTENNTTPGMLKLYDLNTRYPGGTPIQVNMNGKETISPTSQNENGSEYTFVISYNDINNSGGLVNVRFHGFPGMGTWPTDTCKVDISLIEVSSTSTPTPILSYIPPAANITPGPVDLGGKCSFFASKLKSDTSFFSSCPGVMEYRAIGETTGEVYFTKKPDNNESSCLAMINNYTSTMGNKFNYLKFYNACTVGGDKKCTTCKDRNPNYTGPGLERGDANCDGMVSPGDYNEWEKEYYKLPDFTSVNTQSRNDYKSDFNCDSYVKKSDRDTWLQNVSL